MGRHGGGKERKDEERSGQDTRDVLSPQEKGNKGRLSPILKGKLLSQINLLFSNTSILNYLYTNLPTQLTRG